MKTLLTIGLLLSATLLSAQHFILDENLLLVDYIPARMLKQKHISALAVREYFDAADIDTLRMPVCSSHYRFDANGNTVQMALYYKGDTTTRSDLSGCGMINRAGYSEVKCDKQGRLISARNAAADCSLEKSYYPNGRIRRSLRTEMAGEGNRFSWQSDYYYNGDRLDSIVSVKTRKSFNDSLGTFDTVCMRRSTVSFAYQNGLPYRVVSSVSCHGMTEAFITYITYSYEGGLLRKAEMLSDNRVVYRAELDY